MAIGSDAEIGTISYRLGDMDEEALREWSAVIRSWGADLLGGYAVLCEPDPELRRTFAETQWTWM